MENECGCKIDDYGRKVAKIDRDACKYAEGVQKIQERISLIESLPEPYSSRASNMYELDGLHFALEALGVKG